MAEERLELAIIIREALQRTSETTAASMMESYRRGRTVCLNLTQTERPESYDRNVEWTVLAPGEIAPRGAA